RLAGQAGGFIVVLHVLNSATSRAAGRSTDAGRATHAGVGAHRGALRHARSVHAGRTQVAPSLHRTSRRSGRGDAHADLRAAPTPAAVTIAGTAPTPGRVAGTPAVAGRVAVPERNA